MNTIGSTRKQQQEKILVTSALPYANGSIHLGHLVEYIQTDIWVRVQKALGNTCTYVCADDAHGTAIMIRAEKEGISPEALIKKVKEEHEADFSGFLIDFDKYHSTHSEENRTLAEEIFLANYKQGAVIEKNVSQLYDPEKKMFLADRFVKGTCPKCQAKEQYGDNCEVCGATYEAKALIDPISVFSGAKPEEKSNLQLFFDLPKFEESLGAWLDSNSLQEEVANKLKEWFETGLKPWDISRESPYFGFEIPNYPGKYFYVWLDAPIGYIASFKAHCDETGAPEKFDEYWKPNSTAKVYHFIGKDIINFHGLFWPAMLKGANFRQPTAIFAHGFLTINGQKMSKSRGTFINARTYLNHLDPEYLRYYFASKLNASVEDLDLNLEDFMQRVNTDLINKYINIASRCARFIQNDFNGKLAAEMTDSGLTLYQSCYEEGLGIFEDYRAREFSRATRKIMQIADKANQFIDAEKPWLTIKADETKAQAHQVCTLGINLFRLITNYLSPILPVTSCKVADFLNLPEKSWGLTCAHSPLLNTQIKPYEPLMRRIEKKQIEAMVDDSKADFQSKGNEASSKTKSKKEKQSKKNNVTAEPLGEINIQDLQKIDLRIGKIISAEAVEGADKLLKLKVDVGDENRQIFAGIKSAYSPDQLVGKHTLVVANLAPRKMKFGLSEGMLLAAGPGGEDIWLLSPEPNSHKDNESKVKAGMKVK